jgi:hypothetical protein
MDQNALRFPGARNGTKCSSRMTVSIIPIRTTWNRQSTSHSLSQTGISQHKYMTGHRNKSFSRSARIQINEETTRLENLRDESGMPRKENHEKYGDCE